jgi:hypothetical protein
VNRIVCTLVFPQPAARLAALLAIVALQPALAQETAISEVAVDPPGRVARLSYVEGAVSLASADAGEWTDAVLNRPLTSGDRLWLDQDARAELEVGSTTLHLDRETAFGIVKLDDGVLLANLTEGGASIRVRSLGGQEAIQVETPNATVRIRRAGEYTLEVDTDSDRTIVRARRGEAEVTGGSASHLVGENQEGVFTGLDDLRAQIGPIASRTAFESWADDRARREDTSVSSRYVSSEVTGYEDLDDHGDWLYASSYGHVWRPRYLAHDWAPYRFGRWAWISPWGWTWIDDARWGFAPFHYGRWVSLRNRWCWVPGPRHVRPVYAPALVGWTGNPPGGLSAVGYPVRWFPLAPNEVYVPSYQHTPRHARRVNQSNTVIDDATITRAYTARDRLQDYRHRADPSAVTLGERVNPRLRPDPPRYDARDATPRRRVAERDLDAPRAAGQVSVPRPAGDSSAPRAAGVVNRPAPATTSRPPASYSPAAPTPHGSSAPASQSSRREAGDAPARPSPQLQPRNTSRPTYQQP